MELTVAKASEDCPASMHTPDVAREPFELTMLMILKPGAQVEVTCQSGICVESFASCNCHQSTCCRDARISTIADLQLLVNGTRQAFSISWATGILINFFGTHAGLQDKGPQVTERKVVFPG